MNNLMYAMEHSYSEMKIEIDQILKKKDYTAEDENSIFYAVGKCLHAMLDYAERIRSNDWTRIHWMHLNMLIMV